ncbi:hypothetical protein DM02DRAFT_620178, partial [Periconia macrospinosa]
MSGFCSTSSKPAWCNTFNPLREPIIPGSNASNMLQLGIFEWYPAYQSCQQYFLRHAQYDNAVQAVAALINIRLPCQWPAAPVAHGKVPLTHLAGPMASNLPFKWPYSIENSLSQPAPAWVSLVPYIQRLVVTGTDKEGVMHGFFGDDWKEGIGPIHGNERWNYMFAAKSTEWARVRCLYDISPHESVPFMIPLQNIHIHEIESAETKWSRWLAMEDWMLGPRAPDWEDETTKACR